MPKGPGTPRRRSKPTLLRPLDVIYANEGVELPRVTTPEPLDIPLPYRSLLVHESDMTVTLEQHFGGPLAVRALSTFFRAPYYYRRVLLAQEYSGRPVAMGALRLKLRVFEPAIRSRILRAEVPLGRILRDGGVDFRSQAKIFLAVTPNSEMLGVFWMREPRTLYGRQTDLIHKGVKIGDIVEILPPF
jgi:chorismate-pyruvate lyase